MIKHILNKIIFAAVFLTLLSCAKEKTTENIPDSLPKNETDRASVIDDVTAKAFRIGKGRLGPITIGMTMAKANSLLTKFEKQKASAWDFGYDGGGDAWIYNMNNKPVMALVPGMESDSIIAIIAIDKGLKTLNGIYPGMTVKELISFYPNVKVHFSALTGMEYITDGVNGWEMVFQTSDNNMIGEYQDVEEPVLPKRLEVKSNWIDITTPITTHKDTIAKYSPVSDPKVTGCQMLRKGTFTYKDTDGDVVKVKILDGVITEEHKGGKYILMSKMTWKGECEYDNMFIMSSLPDFKLEPGTVMNVVIDKVEGNDIYFTGTAKGKSYHSIITKIK